MLTSSISQIALIQKLLHFALTLPSCRLKLVWKLHHTLSHDDVLLREYFTHPLSENAHWSHTSFNWVPSWGLQLQPGQRQRLTPSDKPPWPLNILHNMGATAATTTTSTTIIIIIIIPPQIQCACGSGWWAAYNPKALLPINHLAQYYRAIPDSVSGAPKQKLCLSYVKHYNQNILTDLNKCQTPPQPGILT